MQSRREITILPLLAMLCSSILAQPASAMKLPAASRPSGALAASTDDDDLFSILHCSTCEGTATLERPAVDGLARLEVFAEGQAPQSLFDLELRLLVDDQWHTVLIEQAVLPDAQVATFDVQEGSAWAWGEVRDMEIDVYALD